VWLPHLGPQHSLGFDLDTWLQCKWQGFIYLLKKVIFFKFKILEHRRHITCSSHTKYEIPTFCRSWEMFTKYVINLPPNQLYLMHIAPEFLLCRAIVPPICEFLFQWHKEWLEDMTDILNYIKKILQIVQQWLGDYVSSIQTSISVILNVQYFTASHDITGTVRKLQ